MKKINNFLPLRIKNSQLTENQRFSEPKNARAFSGIQFSRIEDIKNRKFSK